MKRRRKIIKRPMAAAAAALLLVAAGLLLVKYFTTPAGTLRGIVLKVEFADLPGEEGAKIIAAKFRDMDRYIKDMSYGRVTLKTEVSDRWYRVPRPISHYRIPTADLKVPPGPIFDLTDDVIAEAGEGINLNKYDYIVFYLASPVEKFGMISLSGYPGLFGWKRDTPPRTRAGKEVDVPVAIYCRDAHLGSIVHDIVHLLGGWRDGKRVAPCLFDQDLQAEVGGSPADARKTFLKAIPHVGFWDPLSCHFYQRFMPPPGLCSWTRMRLGWLTPEKIRVVKPGESAEVLLGPLARGDSGTLAIKIPIAGNRYYLIENRQHIGYDRFLPGRGMIILRIDDDAGECMGGESPVRMVNANPKVPLLEGAAFDIGGNESFSDKELGVRVRLLEMRGYSCLVSVEPLAGAGGGKR
jgi:hypothetical protein